MQTRACQTGVANSSDHMLHPPVVLVAHRELLELAPSARSVMGDNGLKEVEKGALVDGFALTDLYRPRSPVPLSLVNNTLGIGHDGVVDENVEMILRCEQRADVA